MRLSDGEALECGMILWVSLLKRPLSDAREAIAAIGFVQQLAQLVQSEATPAMLTVFRAWMGDQAYWSAVGAPGVIDQAEWEQAHAVASQAGAPSATPAR